MKKLLLGIVVSVLFIYSSVSGLEFEKVLKGVEDVDYRYFFPTIIIFLILAFLRSLRWGILIRPIKHISQKELFPIACIGFMAIVVVPMRLGEFVRPYLLREKAGIPFTSGLMTVMMERILDVFTICGIFLVVMLNSNLPPWLEKSGYAAFAGFLAALVFLGLFYFKTNSALRLLEPLLKKLPKHLYDGIENVIQNLLEGFKIIRDPRMLISAILLSALIWSLTGLAFYILFFSYDFNLTLLAAFTVLVANIVGISLPTAPGMLGNFQYPIIVALSLFNIGKDEAFLFSMTYYFIGIGLIVLLGVAFLLMLDISIGDTLKKISSNKSEAVKNELG